MQAKPPYQNCVESDDEVVWGRRPFPPQCAAPPLTPLVAARIGYPPAPQLNTPFHLLYPTAPDTHSQNAAIIADLLSALEIARPQTYGPCFKAAHTRSGTEYDNQKRGRSCGRGRRRRWTKVYKKRGACFRCGGEGHWERDCKEGEDQAGGRAARGWGRQGPTLADPGCIRTNTSSHGPGETDTIYEGRSQSKPEKPVQPVQPGSVHGYKVLSPVIQYMQEKDRHTVDQLGEWVNMGFPDRGSFSLKRLERLGACLDQREKDEAVEYEGKSEKERKNCEPFKADWRGYGMWREEAESRERKRLEKECDNKIITLMGMVGEEECTAKLYHSLSEVHGRVDSDLDSAPPSYAPRNHPSNHQPSVHPSDHQLKGEGRYHKLGGAQLTMYDGGMASGGADRKQDYPTHGQREDRREDRGGQRENWARRGAKRGRDFDTQTRDFLCYMCGRTGHWRRDCPLTPWNKTTLVGGSG